MSHPDREWQTLDINWPCRAAVLAETLDGGQAFRWHQQKEAIWRGQWDTLAVELKVSAEDTLLWRNLSATPDAKVESALTRYLAIDDDRMERATNNLPWRSDPHLAKAIDAFPNLRILRQPFGETLLAFLCSATKQIVQIKQMLALLAERHGSPVESNLIGYFQGTALPTWEQLATISESDLRACQLGFRARYIAQTATLIAGQPDWLKQTEAAPYPEAKGRLMSLPGVGEKVADCVALFGLGHLEAFPVDTWIIKAMARRYGLEGWSPAQVAHFGRTHFGSAAGLAQQYLFAWERRHGGR